MAQDEWFCNMQMENELPGRGSCVISLVMLTLGLLESICLFFMIIISHGNRELNSHYVNLGAIS